MEGDKLWGGRFSSRQNDPNMECLNASLKTDRRMFSEDLEGSQAYARALAKVDLLNADELQLICHGLDEIRVEWSENRFEVKMGDEDIHTANERRLKEQIGEAGTKLHVGRSRNDQVATDMKMWLRRHLKEMDGKIRTLISIMAARSVREIDVLMPGYTHLQRAQPVRWSHYLLNHAWTFKHDSDRLQNLLESTNESPLGSGAIAGNPFGIDRLKLAEELGFEGATKNSMQTVGDRDFVAQFLFWSSMVGLHLSRLAEDLILYSTKEFAFVALNEAYSTGSSLMPQKRNPDSLELIRGIGGTLFGHCCSFMMVLKGLPSTYNKDVQSDKELMFGAFDKLVTILEVASKTVESLTINADRCKSALSYDMLATDLAYYLVRNRQVAFREAHFVAGRVVAEAEAKNVPINKLSLEQLQKISPKFEKDVENVWNYENSVEQYETVGGTSKLSVLQQIEALQNWLLSE